MPQRGESSQALLGNGAKKAVSLYTSRVKGCSVGYWTWRKIYGGLKEEGKPKMRLGGGK
jgi:hypothetical protein